MAKVKFMVTFSFPEYSGRTIYKSTFEKKIKELLKHDKDKVEVIELNHSKMELIERTTTIPNLGTIKSFGLSQNNHDAACQMLKDDISTMDNLGLHEVDDELVNVWISDAHANLETEYAEFLRVALANNAAIYTLVDLTIPQEIGDIAFYRA